MLPYFTTFFSCFLLVSSGNVNFLLNPNSLAVQTFNMRQFLKGSEFEVIEDLHLIVNTTNKITISLSKCSQTQQISILNKTLSVDLSLKQAEILDWLQLLKEPECENRTRDELLLYIQSYEFGAFGNLKFVRKERQIFRKDSDSLSEFFHVSADKAFVKKLKLNSLQVSIELIIISDNLDSSLDIFISFCPTDKGALFYQSFSASNHVIIENPLLEMYYLNYTCDSMSTLFYGNTTHPIAPMLIRFESKKNLSGTLEVKVDGQSPHEHNHLANYESLSFVQSVGDFRTIQIYYHPSDNQIHVLIDIEAGKSAIFISPCEQNLFDIFISNIENKTNQIDINIDFLMSKTKCLLYDINPSLLFLTIKAVKSPNIVKVWRPAENSTWLISIYVIIIIILLAILMFIIINLARRKSGHFNISPLIKKIKK